ncbi:MAG TPA: hypothetical protein DCL54_17055 [Alphaproteobacteria bacterium]|nr:hypothetical protein [Alphaproteobacteria bacterium]HAJ48285.1 hypothetical protein [Alphaproteobacteria bacterium]
MRDERVWRDLLIAYRKKHSLTQSELADRLAVSQQTVSRWESGKQFPDAETQASLRPIIGLLDLSTRESWINRVSLSAGREHLFERGWRFIANSQKILEIGGIPAAELVGHTAYEFPIFQSVLPRVDEAGLFDGQAKLVRIVAEFHFATRSAGRRIDLWPIVTCTDEILVHAIAHPFAVKRLPDTVPATTVKEIDIIRQDRAQSRTRQQGT